MHLCQRVLCCKILSLACTWIEVVEHMKSCYWWAILVSIYIVITGFKTLKFDLHFAHELSVEAWGTSCFRYQMPANFRSFEKVVEARRGLHPSGNPAELTFDGWLADIALSWHEVSSFQILPLALSRIQSEAKPPAQITCKVQHQCLPSGKQQILSNFDQTS